MAQFFRLTPSVKIVVTYNQIGAALSNLRRVAKSALPRSRRTGPDKKRGSASDANRSLTTSDKNQSALRHKSQVLLTMQALGRARKPLRSRARRSRQVRSRPTHTPSV